MRLEILTIVLDGAPFILAQLAALNRLTIDWRWHIVEGAAMNSGSTGWCRPQEPRLSRDGTTAILNGLRSHPRIRLYQRQKWASKDEMVNEPLTHIGCECVLLQMDADEMWTEVQLVRLVDLFHQHVDVNSAQFFCRYFVGPNLVITHESDLANNVWTRAWRYQPGAKFLKHEPPILEHSNPHMPRETTRNALLVFDHLAYVLQSQVEYKEHFYGYGNAVKNWQRLQRHTKFPVRARDFLPWAHENSMIDLLHKT